MSNQRVGNHYLIGSDRFYLFGGALVVLSYVVEAPLRFALDLVKLSALIYLRDLMGVLCALFLLLSWLRGQRSASLMAGVCALLTLHTLIGILGLPRMLQPLLGLKTYMPCLVGVALAPLLERRVAQVTKFAAWCYVITAAGVITNYWVEFPWVGLAMDGPMGELELSKQWWTADGLRIPGFTRVSYIAAQLMLISLGPLLATGIGWLLRLVLIATAGVVISLTTTKGAFTGLALIAVVDLLTVMSGFYGLVAPLLMGTSLVCLALPLIGVQIGRPNGPVPSWAESFAERIGDMWPRAFELLDDPVSVVLGRGVGGIGMPQTFVEPLLFNASDNLTVFLIVSFGVVGPLYLGLLVTRFAVRTRQAPRARTTRWLAAWLAALLGVGLTTGMIEEAVTCVTLGISIGMLFAQRKAHAMLPDRSGNSQRPAREARDANDAIARVPAFARRSRA
ncbi:MAG: hypothetical protein ABW321_09610 [Polyangiales bacterium]